MTLLPAAVPVITVDGPSGVGKGTVSRAIAHRLGWHRLDSGALYRALALAATYRGIALDDAPGLTALAAALDVTFSDDIAHDAVWIDGVNHTADLRLEATGDLASQVAVWPSVRTALVQRQRDFRQAPGLVADGRDMGTVIMPDAALKLFLTASADARADRRYRQLLEQGRDAILIDLRREIAARDERDRTRATAPLVPAEDAVTIDTTTLTPKQVMAKVERLLKARGLR